MWQWLKTKFFPSNLAVFLGLCGLTVVILSSVLLFRQTTFFTNLDNVDQFYTWYQKLASSVHEGHLPIWNSNVFSGQSFAGELQPGIFYPINLLFVMIFGSAQGISLYALELLVALHFVLAAFGAFMVIKQLGAKRWPAIAGGLVFAFSGVVAFRSISQTAIFFGLCLIPYPLYFLMRAHERVKRQIRYLLAAGAFLGLIIISGHIQPFFHALVLLGIYELAVWRHWWPVAKIKPEVIRSVKRFLLVGAACFAIALPQIWVSSYYLGHSYRIQAEGYAGPGEKVEYKYFGKAFNLEIHEAANLVDPNFYTVRDGNQIFIGLLPLGIIVVGLAFARAKMKATDAWRRHKRFLTATLWVSGLAMIGYWTWFAVVLYKLPFVYQVRQLGRYSIMFHLVAAVVVAIAIEALQTFKPTPTQKRKLMAAGTFLAINGVYVYAIRNYVFDTHLALQFLVLGLGLIALAVTKITRYGELRWLVIGGLVVATCLVNTRWFLPNITPETKTSRIYTLPEDLANVLESTNGQYRVEIQHETIPINIGNVYDVQTNWGYAATVYAPYFELTRQERMNREFMNDLLGIRYLVNRDQGTNDVYADNEQQVYVHVRSTALPKVFTTDKEGSLNRADYHGLDVATETYKDHYQRFVFTSDKDQLVILSEIFYPGWKAKLDGKTVELRPYSLDGNELLKSLQVGPGQHTLELEYHAFGLF